MPKLPLALLLASVALGSCASPGPGSRDSTSRRDSDLISREELRGLPGGTAYEAVERLRPIWLRSRGPFGLNQPQVLAEVFLDEQHFGPLAYLRQLNLETVEEIRFLDARDATTRFGTGYPGGIIMVFLKKSP